MQSMFEDCQISMAIAPRSNKTKMNHDLISFQVQHDTFIFRRQSAEPRNTPVTLLHSDIFPDGPDTFMQNTTHSRIVI